MHRPSVEHPFGHKILWFLWGYPVETSEIPVDMERWRWL
jgi:hypothetical protein